MSITIRKCNQCGTEYQIDNSESDNKTIYLEKYCSEECWKDAAMLEGGEDSGLPREGFSEEGFPSEEKESSPSSELSKEANEERFPSHKSIMPNQSDTPDPAPSIQEELDQLSEGSRRIAEPKGVTVKIDGPLSSEGEIPDKQDYRDKSQLKQLKPDPEINKRFGFGKPRNKGK